MTNITNESKAFRLRNVSMTFSSDAMPRIRAGSSEPFTHKEMNHEIQQAYRQRDFSDRYCC